MIWICVWFVWEVGSSCGFKVQFGLKISQKMINFGRIECTYWIFIGIIECEKKLSEKITIIRNKIIREKISIENYPKKQKFDLETINIHTRWDANSCIFRVHRDKRESLTLTEPSLAYLFIWRKNTRNFDFWSIFVMTIQ